MIQTAECKPSAAILWSPSWQTMLRGDSAVHAFPLFELCSSAAIQCRGTRRAVHTCRSERDECVLTFSLTRCVYDYLSSYPTPTHTFPLPCDFWIYCCQYLLGDFFFNKPLIKHTQTHKNNAAISHTQTHRSVCWRQEHGVLSTHTHTHTYTSTCMLLPFQTTGCWGNRSAPPFFLIKAIRASAFISTTTAGATICFYYRFASFNLFLPCNRNTLSKKHTWARIYFPFPMLKCLYVCIWVAACVCVCVWQMGWWSWWEREQNRGRFSP